MNRHRHDHDHDDDDRNRWDPPILPADLLGRLRAEPGFDRDPTRHRVGEGDLSGPGDHG